jgi:two-component system C4-dicarboxylate transport sensor histidine kinase DctB
VNDDERPSERGLDNPLWPRVARLAELGVLTSSLLHEIRQPLFAIKAHAELAAVTLDGRAAERMHLLLGHVAHIELLMAHYGSLGRDDQPAAVIDLREPVEAALAMLDHRVRAVDASLSVELPRVAVRVMGQEHALRQVVLNLVQNALDALEGQAARALGVSVTAGADGARLSVQDSGPGIPDEVRARLFEPFVTSKPVGQGTGLGLHITRVLAEQAGGEVSLDSGPAGTTVTVTLPLAG